MSDEPGQGRTRKGRYDTVRDYMLLVAGTGFAVSGVALAVEGSQIALALIGAALTCWGLVPTLQRDKP
jgi:Flp pilus assembly protein TadB